MFESKNRAALIVAAIGLLSIGFGACWVTKPAPEPDIQWNFRDGLTVNGKRVDLDKLGVKLPLPVLPAPDKGKRKPGDLPSGDLPKAGPAASHKMYNVKPEHIVRNCGSTVDGAGLCVPSCIETIALNRGFTVFKGFQDHAKVLPGGHWPEKTQKQFDCFCSHMQGFGGPPCSLVIKDGNDRESHKGLRRVFNDELEYAIDNHGPVMIAYSGRIDEKHYGNQKVCTALILNGYNKATGLYSVVDTNYPEDKSIVMDSDKVSRGCEWYAYLQSANPPFGPAAFLLFDQDPLSPYPHMQNVLAVVSKGDNLDCPCGESCACKPCHCHAAKPITFNSEDDPPMVVGQRGGKPVEAFGIEALAGILRELKEAVFGTNGKHGLKDDISGGLKDFWGSVKVGFIVAGGVTLTALGWIGLSLQRIADSASK